MKCPVMLPEKVSTVLDSRGDPVVLEEARQCARPVVVAGGLKICIRCELAIGALPWVIRRERAREERIAGAWPRLRREAMARTASGEPVIVRPA